VKTKAEAMRIARDVAKQLGAPWKPRVWENLGWHACVDFGDGYLAAAGREVGIAEGMTLYIHPRGNHYNYSVMAICRVIGEGRTARAAARKAHAYLDELSKDVRRLMVPLWSAIGGKR